MKTLRLTSFLFSPLVLLAFCVPAMAQESEPVVDKPSFGDKVIAEPKAETTNPTKKVSAEPKVDEPAKKLDKNPRQGKKNTGPVYRWDPYRYQFHFLAWIDEPYIAYRMVPDPYTGRVHRVQVIRYNRILRKIYYDRQTNTYGYFDNFGNPVPYLPARYRLWFTPF